MNKNNSNRLSVKDLILIGVLNVVALVCYAVAVALSCMTIVGLFYSTAAAFLLMGTIYMLITAKVHKRGTFFLCGALMSLIGLFGGRIFTTLGCLAGGALAEFLAGKYKNFGRIAVAYMGYAVAVACGVYLPGFIIGTDYLLTRGAARGITTDTITQYERFFNMKTLCIVLVLNAFSALFGALLGRFLLKKHFMKAGIVKENKEYKVFPWWKAKLFGSILCLRRGRQNPEIILKDYLVEGMTVADIGSGMGYFAIPMAERVGKHGLVVAVDLQKEMLQGLKKRAEKAGVQKQIELHNCVSESLQLDEWKESFDFVLLFAVAHEVPNRSNLFKELASVMKPGAKILFAEPAGHVKRQCFEESLQYAKECGFERIGEPEIKMSHSALLRKNSKK